MNRIKVLIVDDHALMREGIHTLLDLVPDFDIVGEASDGKQAIEKVRELQPDVVLMDLAMPVMTGQEATRRIREEFPQVKILALTQYESTEYVIPIIRLGAHGFVTKAGESPEIISAIRAVHNGQSYLSAAAATALVQDYQAGAQRQEAQEGAGDIQRRPGIRKNQERPQAGPGRRQLCKTALFQVTMLCLPERARENDFRDYSKRKVSRGKRKISAVASTMGKLTEVIYHCLQTGERYTY